MVGLLHGEDGFFRWWRHWFESRQFVCCGTEVRETVEVNTAVFEAGLPALLSLPGICLAQQGFPVLGFYAALVYGGLSLFTSAGLEQGHNSLAQAPLVRDRGQAGRRLSCVLFSGSEDVGVHA